MSGAPKRFREDPNAPSELRRDLEIAAGGSTPAYDVHAGLAKLRARFDGAATPAGGASGATGVGAKFWISLTLIGIPTVALIAMWALGSSKERPMTAVRPSVSSSVVAPHTEPDMTNQMGAAPPQAPRQEASAPESASTAPAMEAPTAPSSGLAASGDRSRKPSRSATNARPVGKRTARERPHGHGPPLSQPRATETETSTSPDVAEPTAEERTRGGGAANSAIHEEIAELAEARRLLTTAPVEALALVERGQREFQHGMFSEEREAIAVFALSRLGRTARARDQGLRFLNRHPNGPFSEHIRRILADMPPAP